MKTCISSSSGMEVWLDCKYVLKSLNYHILQENPSGGRISARSRISDSPKTVLIDVCLINVSSMTIVSVDAVQNDTSDGMLSTYLNAELSFIEHLMRTTRAIPVENGFKLRED